MTTEAKTHLLTLSTAELRHMLVACLQRQRELAAEVHEIERAIFIAGQREQFTADAPERPVSVAEAMAATRFGLDIE